MSMKEGRHAKDQAADAKDQAQVAQGLAVINAGGDLKGDGEGQGSYGGDEWWADGEWDDDDWYDEFGGDDDFQQ